MAEKRVLSGVDQFELFATQLRHRMLELGGKPASKIDKLGATLLAADRLNNYFRV